MFEQYMGVKAVYPDSLLFFRMGDFFELFFEDAETTARELQLTLTSRNPQAEAPIPMCGVPHHALDAYLPQLLEKGYKVVICDQVEKPSDAKGLVKRAVTRVLTPATVVEESSLSGKGHNFLGALYWDAEKNSGGFAWADNSTGSWSGLQSGKQSELWQWVQKLAPRELLLPQLREGAFKPPTSIAQSLDQARVQLIHVPVHSFFALPGACDRILQTQEVKELGALGLTGKAELCMACGAVLAYLEQTQRQAAKHLSPFTPLNLSKHLIIDEITERNLELFRRLDGKSGKKGLGTLKHELDETVTPMGGRLLEERLRQPWREAGPINETLDLVQHFFEQPEKLEAVRRSLKTVYDLERLSTRICLDRAYPRDFAALGQSLAVLPALRDILKQAGLNRDKYLTAPEEHGLDIPGKLRELLQGWDSLEDACGLLGKALADNLPLTVTEGGLFRQGYNAELDELIDLTEHGEQRIQELWEREKAAFGLPKLKMGQNRVFGYYFELGRSASENVPPHFVRRQTLANAERFSTAELSELEQKMLAAAERRNNLEYTLFKELRGQIAALRSRFLYMAQVLALIDYWQSLAQCARQNGWSRPKLHGGLEIKIRQGRHPVVERIQGRGNFVPNDLFMDDRRRLLLITGPNMSGKSTVLRQTAIICLMAQMGSFVPAEEAEIGLVDRIFSRVGASDNLAQGQSTFMVEMMETARILRQSGKRSLVILDEIGRGTSTYDGLALAWAVVEELALKKGLDAANSGIRTLFATHYHELTVLDGLLPGVHNMNVAIREWGGELVFLRRLVPGPSNRSYGIEVAKLAGVPAGVVQRARQILERLERAAVGGLADAPQTEPQMGMLPGFKVAEPQAAKPGCPGYPGDPGTLTCPGGQNSLDRADVPHPLLISLGDLDVNSISPLRALEILHEWKTLWGKND
ncbi:MAG: DNA mismatch repair protein MutS [Deltaproteobacteria bacterium]|nr:DNA mismatch repair protein MutS [Deltaproteobacteria bacterium]